MALVFAPKPGRKPIHSPWPTYAYIYRHLIKSGRIKQIELWGTDSPVAVLHGKLSHRTQRTADLTHFTADSTQLTVHGVGFAAAYRLQFKPHGL